MARIEVIKLTEYSTSVVDERVVWKSIESSRACYSLPQIFLRNGIPWREANLWAFERATELGKNARTVLAGITALNSYAQWLEENEIDWMHFPERKRDRNVFRYRGHLIDARDKGRLAPSTVSERMRVVIGFYRWAQSNGMLSAPDQLWRDQSMKFSRQNSFGITRTFSILKSELSIPNRTVQSSAVEGGLMPVSSADRNALISFARHNASEEFHLLLSLGFFSGMRLGTLTDLKVQSLETAYPDPQCKALYRLRVGPGARPSVSTKFGITGEVYIPCDLLELLKEYSHSPRRLLRQAKANLEHSDLLFLTKFGNPYAQRGADKSVAINVEMHTFRKRALASGMQIAKNFKFHQSRATFGTEIARIGIRYIGVVAAVSLVKDALLQRDEQSALRYIRFVENTPIKIEMANEFTRSFLGIFDKNTETQDF